MKSPTDPSGPIVNGFLTGVQSLSGAQTASQEAGSPPAGGGGPSASVTTISSAVNGGSNLVTLHSTAPFSQVIVSAGNGSTTAPVLADSLRLTQAATSSTSGFYKLVLPSAATDQTIVVSFAQSMPYPEFDLLFQLVSPTGSVGPAASSHVSLLEAGVGVVQVTASWDQLTDVDLHVIEPNQNEVFWFAATSSTGGVLDLDSNQACHLDGKNTENIRWSTNAPSGPYIVRLDYFARCNLTANTNYVVTVHNGTSTTIFTGSFSQDQADAGNLGAGRTITTFTHTGPSAVSRLFNAPGSQPSVGPPSAEKIRLSFNK